ncbi:MAG TPA: S8 family serine peptidase [Candidatus Lokiarchaeia archaeon]|nr:S8 family serine peptidase [Candidatus Lokiarchaeia archaeon]
MSRFIVQFQSPDAKAQFLDQNGVMNDIEFSIQLNGKSFVPVHDLATLPVLVIEPVQPGEEIIDGNILFKDVKGIKSWESDVALYLAGSSACTILNINFINKSIYGPFHGDNIPVAIIDSGVDISHPDLEGCILAQKKFRKISREAVTAEQDDLGHGTAIAGIICGSGSSSGGKYTGIVTGAKIIDCNAFDGSGKGLLSDVLSALEFAAASGAKVICMPFSSLPVAKPSKIFENLLVHLASELQIVLCAGTGNGGPEESTIGMPGCYDCVLTTGSLTPNLMVSVFSGRGAPNSSKPDFCLPGEDIFSLNVEHSLFKDQVVDENEYYATFTGNSMSVAVLAGIVTMIVEVTPYLKPEDIKWLMRASCLKIRRAAKISAGYGIMNLTIMLKRLNVLYAFHKSYVTMSKEMILLASTIIFFTVAVSMMLASFI